MKPHIFAFYLPQYHPTEENDINFGKGYTEWTNVAKAKPLYKGHIQPKIPADLGFYDLRLPEVRDAQAKLAKEAGISAFCYYHYWFGNNKVVLDRPLNEVIALKEPDFPFCICWANHSWYKKDWNPTLRHLENKLLFEQTYLGENDIISHFNYLLPVFKDNRYYRIEGKLVFVIYNIGDQTTEYWDKFKEIWNNLAKRNNLPEFYFIAYTSKLEDLDKPLYQSFEKTIISLVTNIQYKQDYSFTNKLRCFIKSVIADYLDYPQFLYTYKEAIPFLLCEHGYKEDVIPVVVPNWDYTPRRGAGGLILKDSTPQLFQVHLRQALNQVKGKEQPILFIKSWNEWGEGNYLEPDLQYGRAYLDILKDEIEKYK